MTPERYKRLTQVLDKRQPDITLVLENVFDPHNVSAVLRTCDAVGIQELYIVNTILPPHKRFGPRSSSSAAKWMTIHSFDDTRACVEAVRQRFPKIMTTHLSTDAIGLYQMDFTQPIALVFGNEHSGVSEEMRQLADGNFIIPQSGIIRSLNISVACAVTIYEAYRQKEVAGHYAQSRLPREQYEQLLADWGYKGDPIEP